MSSKIEHTPHTHGCVMSNRVRTCKGKHTLCDNTGECELPYTNGICENYECNITAELDKYKQLLEDTKSDLAKAKALNTQFRVMLLMPTQAERFLHKGEVDFSGISGIVNKHKQSLDSVDDETVLWLVEYHQKFAEQYSQYAHERNSKVKIKDDVIAARKRETINAVTSIAEQEKKKEAAKKATTPYGRSLAAYMKAGMSEADARETLRQMGVKE